MVSLNIFSFFFNWLIGKTFSLYRERRAPFSPAIVKRLIKNGVKVIVQPSNRRAYPMQVCRIVDKATAL